MNKEIKCPWCDKEFVRIAKQGNRQKFCSIRCREEFHNLLDPRHQFYDSTKKRNDFLKNKTSFVQCEICGQIVRQKLEGHIKRRHYLSWKDYKSAYPNAINNCIEISDHMSSRQIGKKNAMHGLLGNKNPNFKGGWLSIKRMAIKQRGYKCEKCGFKKHPEVIEAHHKIPKKNDGENSLKNCELLCANCHKLRTIKKLHPYLQQMI